MKPLCLSWYSHHSALLMRNCRSSGSFRRHGIWRNVLGFEAKAVNRWKEHSFAKGNQLLINLLVYSNMPTALFDSNSRWDVT